MHISIQNPNRLLIEEGLNDKTKCIEGFRARVCTYGGNLETGHTLAVYWNLRIIKIVILFKLDVKVEIKSTQIN